MKCLNDLLEPKNALINSCCFCIVSVKLNSLSNPFLLLWPARRLKCSCRSLSPHFNEIKLNKCTESSLGHTSKLCASRNRPSRNVAIIHATHEFGGARLIRSRTIEMNMQTQFSLSIFGDERTRVHLKCRPEPMVNSMWLICCARALTFTERDNHIWIDSRPANRRRINFIPCETYSNGRRRVHTTSTINAITFLQRIEWNRILQMIQMHFNSEIGAETLPCQWEHVPARFAATFGASVPSATALKGVKRQYALTIYYY